MKNLNEKHKFIPYGRQWIDESDIKAVEEILRGEFLTTGPTIKEFEDKLAEITNTKYAVAISNGTAALHAACFAAGVGEGDEVITSPITFAASANCALYVGAKPVFADIDPNTYNIDPNEIRKKITKKTKAIIPVHFTGQPCDMDEILNIAREYNLTIIEDGAHSLGADYKGRKIGGIGDITTFSFHPVKHITTGEGGAILTNCKETYEKLLMFRSHGITRHPEKLIANDGPWYYEQQYLGYNYRITDLQAALGLSQLKRLQSFINRRREIVSHYNKAFKSLDGVIIPDQLEGANNSWHLYILQFELEKISIDRKQIFEEFSKNKIGVNVHYIPVYYHPYYQNLGYSRGLCPKAEKLYERIISIPLYPKMLNEEVEFVINTVKGIVEKFKK